MKTLAELGNLLPDDYHWIKCDLSHPVEVDDIPGLTDWYCRRDSCLTQREMSYHLRPDEFCANSASSRTVSSERLANEGYAPGLSK